MNDNDSRSSHPVDGTCSRYNVCTPYNVLTVLMWIDSEQKISHMTLLMAGSE